MAEPMILVKSEQRIPRMGLLESLFITTQNKLDDCMGA